MGAMNEENELFRPDNARKRREDLDRSLGDAAPELIVPLRRGPDGRLGVAGSDLKGG